MTTTIQDENERAWERFRSSDVGSYLHADRTSFDWGWDLALEAFGLPTPPTAVEQAATDLLAVLEPMWTQYVRDLNAAGGAAPALVALRLERLRNALRANS